MIECIFTIDYEIYGNGEGSLREIVHDPAERLRQIFDKFNARFVIFVEVAELEMIKTQASDPAIDLVQKQLRCFKRNGFELGLHIHPWWYNAKYEDGKWLNDYSDYNLSALPENKISQHLDRAMCFLREFLEEPDFTPISFRAGHLLFHPGRILANKLASRGIKLDSSVYKGGLWRQHKLDYRRALANGYYWGFTDCINIPDPKGILIEVPIYTQMVPIWKMFTFKRVGLQQKGASVKQTGKKLLYRLMDLLRFSYPLKFDGGQMTKTELMEILNRAIKEDQKNPKIYRPIVNIMHTKDPIDFQAIDYLLSCLKSHGIAVTTFKKVHQRILANG